MEMLKTEKDLKSALKNAKSFDFGGEVMEYISENLKTPITKKCDVLVAGGGIAGISAALAAARSGAKTILLEKQFMLGGLGTCGLVTIYLPLCDGCGNQVSFGIAEELLMLSIKHGADAKYPKPWLEGGTVEEKSKRRFEVQYNPYIFAILAEKLLLKEGVEIMYGTSACSVKCENGKIENVVVENKSGRSAIAVKSVVDCTGDADVAQLSGVKCEKYSYKNILAAWYYYADKNGGFNLRQRGAADEIDNPVEKLIDRTFEAVENDELCEMTYLSHDSIYSDFVKHREKDEDYAVTSIATIPQVRMTRRIAAEYDLDIADDHKKFDDSVGMFSSWRKAGPVFEIPFRSLYSRDVKNLAAAGRCFGVKDNLWDLSRVIPVCAVSGEAAGCAAAMSDDFTSLDVSALQKKLTQNGVKLHLD